MAKESSLDKGGIRLGKYEVKVRLGCNFGSNIFDDGDKLYKIEAK